MAAIWKFNLPLSGTVAHLMPLGAQPVSVAFQGDSLSLWAKVDPAVGTEKRFFHVLLTGQQFDENELRFIGTALCDDGAYVVHVFEDPL